MCVCVRAYSCRYICICLNTAMITVFRFYRRLAVRA